MKIYKIYIEEILIGTTNFESGDPPMGVVFGEIRPLVKLNYQFIKDSGIEIAEEIKEDNFVTTFNSNLIKVYNENKIEIKGEGNQISGMDKFGFEISILGISYPFYEKEFPRLVIEYENRLK